MTAVRLASNRQGGGKMPGAGAQNMCVDTYAWGVYNRAIDNEVCTVGGADLFLFSGKWTFFV